MEAGEKAIHDPSRHELDPAQRRDAGGVEEIGPLCGGAHRIH